MELNTIGIKLSDKQTEKILEGLSRKLSRMLPKGAQFDVKVCAEKNGRVKAEVTVRHVGYYAKGVGWSETHNLQESVNEAIADLKRKIRKVKTRRLSSKQRAAGLSEIIGMLEEERTAMDDRAQGEVRKVKQVELMMMTSEEAIEQMELLGHNFFLFQNESGAPCVLYTRPDGYGILVGS